MERLLAHVLVCIAFLTIGCVMGAVYITHVWLPKTNVYVVNKGVDNTEVVLYNDNTHSDLVLTSPYTLRLKAINSISLPEKGMLYGKKVCGEGEI